MWWRGLAKMIGCVSASALWAMVGVAGASAHEAAKPHISVKIFTLPGGAQPSGQFATGPKGELWFAEGTNATDTGRPPGGEILGGITSGGAIQQVTDPDPNFAAVGGVAFAGNGELEFGCFEQGQSICTRSPSGTVSRSVDPSNVDTAVGRLAVDSAGNTWIVGVQELVRVAASGATTTYPLPHNLEPNGIVKGPGGIWFTATVGTEAVAVHDYIGRFSPSGQLTLFRIPRLGSEPKEIAVGPDGNMWFAERGGVERLTPGGHFKRFRFKISGSQPGGIAAGKGGMWFTDAGTNKIGFITLSGNVTEYRSGTRDAGLSSIAVRRDGIWYQDIPDEGAGHIGHLVVH